MDASSPGIGLPRPSLRAALGPGAALLAVLGLAAGAAVTRRARLLAPAAAGGDEREQLRARLRELEQAKTDLVSSVSHELRTPLTSIIGYLELLAAGDFGELAGPQRQAFAAVERNSRRLLALIDDLLALSRIESGTFVLELRPVALDALLERVRQALAARPVARRLELVTSLPDEPLVVLGDPAELERALRGLVGNAMKFSRDGGLVRLGASRDGDRAELVVSDHGTGIPLAEQPALFSPFFRATGARQGATQGTGVGLAIVKHIVERHGGTITLESAPGSGTTVRLTLPLARVAGAPATADPASG